MIDFQILKNDQLQYCIGFTASTLRPSTCWDHAATTLGPSSLQPCDRVHLRSTSLNLSKHVTSFANNYWNATLIIQFHFDLFRSIRLLLSMLVTSWSNTHCCVYTGAGLQRNACFKLSISLWRPTMIKWAHYVWKVSLDAFFFLWAFCLSGSTSFSSFPFVPYSFLPSSLEGPPHAINFCVPITSKLFL